MTAADTVDSVQRSSPSGTLPLSRIRLVGSRRRVLKIALAGAASRTLGSSATPLLGLIARVEVTVPPEAATLYPSSVRFPGARLGLETMTPEGYDRVLEHIAPAAQALARAGADAIVLMGASLSFYRGASFNRELTPARPSRSDRPAITMSTAVCDGLRAFRARRLAVATAYDAEVDQRLQSFLPRKASMCGSSGALRWRGSGFESVTRTGLMKFSTEVFQSADRAEALLISCGGLRTLDLLAPLEERCGIPVVSSLPHALRAGVRLLGLSGHVGGYGRLFR